MTDGNLNIDLTPHSAQYVKTWRLLDCGVQVYDYPDHLGAWIVQSCECPACLHQWQAVAPERTWGIECPQCHEVDLTWEWRVR